MAAALARRCVWNCICEAIVTYVALRVRLCVSMKTARPVRSSSSAAAEPSTFICVVMGFDPMRGSRNPEKARLASRGAAFGAALAAAPPAGRFVRVEDAAEAGRADFEEPPPKRPPRKDLGFTACAFAI